MINASKYNLEFRPRYWEPGAGDGERVTIATVSLDSQIETVIEIWARRKGSKIRYGIAHESGTRFKFHPRGAVEPLSLGELIDLINSVEGVYEDSKGLTSSFRDAMLADGDDDDPSALLDSVSVESEFYPELKVYYVEEAIDWLEGAWAERRARELEEEESELDPEERARRQAGRVQKEFLEFVFQFDTTAEAWRSSRRSDWLLMMLDQFVDDNYERELRLFACWCTGRALTFLNRIISHRDLEGASRAAVQVARQFARGRVTAQQMSAAREAFRARLPKTFSAPPFLPIHVMEARIDAVLAVTADRAWDGARKSAKEMVSAAWMAAHQSAIRRRPTGTKACKKAEAAMRAAEAAQAAMLRKILGNPFAMEG
jgi:hypothetical protein